jgi:hypothetical protein
MSRDVHRVRYLSIDRFGLTIVHILIALGCCREVSQTFFDPTAHSRRGGSIFDWIHLYLGQAGPRITERLCRGQSIVDFFPSQISRRRCRGLIQKMVQLEAYTPVMLSVLADHHERSVETDVDLVVIARVSDLAPLLESELREELNVRVVGYSDLRGWRFTVLGRFFVVVTVGVLRRAVATVFSGKIDRGGDGPHPMAAVQYTHGMEGSNFRRNDLWWFPDSNLHTDRCLLLFNRWKSPATDEILSMVESLGFRPLILNDRANHSSRRTHGFPTQPIGRTARDLYKCAVLLVNASSFDAFRWQVALWLATMIQVRRYQRLMEMYNIRAIFDGGETDRDSLSLAADLAGAVRFGYHWSAVYPMNARVLTLHQVYFVWGSRNLSMCADRPDVFTDVFLQSGCISDVDRPKDVSIDEIDDARRRIGLTSVRNVVAVLDKSMGGYYGPERHVEFYEALLTWVESEPSLGVVFKYKAKADVPSVFEHAPELAQRAERLRTAGRIALLGGVHPVSEGTLVSDFVIAMGWNSAGFVAALGGLRTVFWDPARLAEGPAKDRAQAVGWGNPEVVFRDMTRLIDSVQAYFVEPSGSSGLGDLSGVVETIDPFRDGHAAFRIGSFVGCLIEQFERYPDRSEALDRALGEYRKTWGADKVFDTRGGAPAFVGHEHPTRVLD